MCRGVRTILCCRCGGLSEPAPPSPANSTLMPARGWITSSCSSRLISRRSSSCAVSTYRGSSRNFFCMSCDSSNNCGVFCVAGRRASSPALRGRAVRSSRRLLRTRATARRRRPSFSGRRWRHDSRVDRGSRSIGASAARKKIRPGDATWHAAGRLPARSRARPARGRAVAPSRAYPSPARSPREPKPSPPPPRILCDGVARWAREPMGSRCASAGKGDDHGDGSGGWPFRRPTDGKIVAG